MKFDTKTWKAEDQTITRLIKNDFNGNKYDFLQDVTESYTFDEYLQIYPTVKMDMKLRDEFKLALANGEIKQTGEGRRRNISTPSLQKWCNKVGKSEKYIRTYGCGEASKRDKLLKLADGVTLNSNDDDFERYCRNSYWKELDTLYLREKEWFRSNDEYSVICDRVHDKIRMTQLSLPKLSMFSNRIEDTINGEKVWRSLTLDEYRQLEAFLDDYIARRDEFVKTNYPFN